MGCDFNSQSFALQSVPMSQELDIEVRSLLQAKRGEWRRIANEGGVSYSWVSQFVRGKIPNPGFATLKRLHRLMKTAGENDAPTAGSEAGS